MRFVRNREQFITRPLLERLFKPLQLTRRPLIGDDPTIGVLDVLRLGVLGLKLGA